MKEHFRHKRQCRMPHQIFRVCVDWFIDQRGYIGRWTSSWYFEIGCFKTCSKTWSLLFPSEFLFLFSFHFVTFTCTSIKFLLQWTQTNKDYAMFLLTCKFIIYLWKIIYSTVNNSKHVIVVINMICCPICGHPSYFTLVTYELVSIFTLASVGLVDQNL